MDITLVSAISTVEVVAVHPISRDTVCPCHVCMVAILGEAHAADMNIARRDILAEENRWVSLLRINTDNDPITTVHNLIRNHVEILRSITFNLRRNVKTGEQCRF